MFLYWEDLEEWSNIEKAKSGVGSSFLFKLHLSEIHQLYQNSLEVNGTSLQKDFEFEKKYKELRVRQRSENEVYRIYRSKEILAMLNKSEENMGIWKPLATVWIGFTGHEKSSLDSDGKFIQAFVWNINNSIPVLVKDLSISNWISVEKLSQYLSFVPEPLLILPNHSILQVSDFMKNWDGDKVGVCHINENDCVFILRPEALLSVGLDFLYINAIMQSNIPTLFPAFYCYDYQSIIASQ